MNNFMLFYASFIAVLFWSDTSAQSDGDRINGIWYTPKGRAAFDFYRDGQEYNAKLIALEKPDLKDSRNPVDSLKNRKLDGATTIYGLIYDPKKQQWHGGKVYNPEDGKTYSCFCYFTDNEALVFRGYLGFPALGKSQIWKRNNPRP